MRKLTASLTLLLVATAVHAASYDFATTVDNLDRRKVTKMHASQYCKDARGHDVTWSGKVHDVRGGRRSAKIFVANDARPMYKGYNIVVVTGDLDRAAKVAKGERIKFRGQIGGCTLKDNGAILEVENADIL
ncbi:MAG TPA: hypothetical protein VM240_10315 [Verrucomicrobiae bacterium]|nr:hypothetical protein [Verrucomicrobiae bacterium]